MRSPIRRVQSVRASPKDTARETANGDVERRLDGPAAHAQQERERLVHIVNQNIGFRADVQVANKLRVGVRAQLTASGKVLRGGPISPPIAISQIQEFTKGTLIVNLH